MFLLVMQVICDVLMRMLNAFYFGAPLAIPKKEGKYLGWPLIESLYSRSPFRRLRGSWKGKGRQALDDSTLRSWRGILGAMGFSLVYSSYSWVVSM